MMGLPPKLPQGGTIGIVAPASACARAQLDAARIYLKAQGYRVRFGEALFGGHRDFAGTDRDRADDLQRMFADSDVDAIICARGGYGSGKVAGRLDFEAIRGCPKPLIGFSDTTFLQLALWRHAGLVSFSGATAAPDLGRALVNEVLERSLWEAVAEHRFAPATTLRMLRDGEAAGPLLGGCLSLICAMVGTPFLPDLTGAILVLEDVGEAPYRIDRMLTQLGQAGILARLGGLVFGQFIGTGGGRDKGWMEAVFAEFAEQVRGPVAAGLDYGHGAARRVLPLGAPVRLAAGSLAVEGG